MVESIDFVAKNLEDEQADAPSNEMNEDPVGNDKFDEN